MLSLKFIIYNTEYVKNKLKQRNFDITIIDQILELHNSKSQKIENFQYQKNVISKQIGNLISKIKNSKEEKENVKNLNLLQKEADFIKKQIDEINNDEKNKDYKIKQLLLEIPNITNNNVPFGKDENNNIVIKQYYSNFKIIKKILPHYEIGQKLQIVDFEKTVKISGTRFWSYKNLGAKLVRALENFMLDTHVLRGYSEWRPPVIVKSKMLEGTGQLPKFAADLFKLENREMYLIPTAEVSLTNLFRDEIIDLEKPISLTAFTNCFRSEAGSSGKDTKGLIRGHQFNKVELVKFVNKENLQKEFQKTLEDAKFILKELKLPFQELRLCSGDVGFSAEETIDLEVWMPSENKYREISSVSSFADFQARRAMIRYKNKIGKNEYACTINGSGLAIDRCVAAILENYQNNDGSITIPKVLVPYMKTKFIK